MKLPRAILFDLDDTIETDPLPHAAATTPVQQTGVLVAQKITHPYQPSPIPLSGRPAHRPFRGLLGVHSRCGLHTRAVTNS